MIDWTIVRNNSICTVAMRNIKFLIKVTLYIYMYMTYLLLKAIIPLL